MNFVSNLARAKRFDGFRQPLFDQPGPLGGNASKIGWRRCGCQHQGQGDHREAKPRNPGREEHVVGVGNIQAEDIEGHMFQRLDVLENRQREEEEKDRQSR